MAEQPANYPGINVSLGGLGEQQITAGLKYAIKLGQRLFLLDQMMKGLVAEQQVNAGVRDIECRAIAADQFDVQALTRRFFAAQYKAVWVGVNADQALRGKGLADRKSVV